MTDPKHMRIAKFLTTILGLWPVKLNGWPLRLYNWYFYLSFGYYIIIDCTLIAKAVMIFGVDWKETATNLGVTIVYIINIYKMMIIKSAPIRKIINEIEDKENFILGCGDKAISDIYLKCAKSVQKSCLFYVIYGTCGISLYFITPLLVQRQLAKQNQSVAEHVYIFSSWFPFDPDKHYKTAYAIHLIEGFYGYSYIVYGGAFFFSILGYFIGQLQILQHIFKNFTHYAKQYQKNNDVSFEAAQRILIRCIMEEHKNIINYVETLDRSLSLFVFMDFVISSFQLSLLVLQMMEASMTMLQQIMVFSYFSTLSFQLFFMYWNAHGIIDESLNLGQAAFESDWITYATDVQKYYILIIARTQKPISLSIGPVYKMKVEALLSIFKAIYSYVALIQQT